MDRKKNEKLLFIIILFLILKTNLSYALIVYDCAHNQTTWSEVDLIEPAPCPDPETDYNKPSSTNVQILQTDEDIPVTAY